MRKLLSAAALCLAAAAGGFVPASDVFATNPIPSGQDESSVVGKYKAAMDAKRWLQAYELAAKLTDAAPSDSLAWYRRARAAAFGERWEDARQAIDKAKTLDPAMKFSQDTRRVKALEDKIASGLEIARVKERANKVASDVAVQQSIASNTSSTEQLVPVVTPAVFAPAIPASAAADPAKAEPSARQPVIKTADREPLGVPAAPGQSSASGDVTPVLAVLLCILILLAGLAGGCAFAAWRQVRSGRKDFAAFMASVDRIQAEHSSLAEMANVFEGMTRVQREAHALRGLLEKQGLVDTAICDAVDSFLPVLERNIGLAPLHELEMRGMNASGLANEEVTRRLLQVQRTGRYTIAVPV